MAPALQLEGGSDFGDDDYNPLSSGVFGTVWTEEKITLALKMTVYSLGRAGCSTDKLSFRGTSW